MIMTEFPGKPKFIISTMKDILIIILLPNTTIALQLWIQQNDTSDEYIGIILSVFDDLNPNSLCSNMIPWIRKIIRIYITSSRFID
jgi:hypothetical protein